MRGAKKAGEEERSRPAPSVGRPGKKASIGAHQLALFSESGVVTHTPLKVRRAERGREGGEDREWQHRAAARAERRGEAALSLSLSLSAAPTCGSVSSVSSSLDQARGSSCGAAVVQQQAAAMKRGRLLLAAPSLGGGPLSLPSQGRGSCLEHRGGAPAAGWLRCWRQRPARASRSRGRAPGRRRRRGRIVLKRGWSTHGKAHWLPGDRTARPDL